MMQALVQLRGEVNMNQDVRDTLGMLNVHSVNHATFVPETETYSGMVSKVNDYVAYGEPSVETVALLVRRRGEPLEGEGDIDGAATAASPERSGSYADGNWVGPFVYEVDYDPELRCIHEEVFGPHVALIEYEGDIDDALAIHNDTKYGLAAAIISEDYRQINRFRDRAEVGLAYANLPCIGAEVQLPFGGVKKSGKGAPSAREVIEAVTERTAWTLNNSTDVRMAQGLSADITTEGD